MALFDRILKIATKIKIPSEIDQKVENFKKTDDSQEYFRKNKAINKLKNFRFFKYFLFLLELKPVEILKRFPAHYVLKGTVPPRVKSIILRVRPDLKLMQEI